MTKEIDIKELLQPELLGGPESFTYDTYVHEKKVGTLVLKIEDEGQDLWQICSEYKDYDGVCISSQVMVNKKDLKPLSTNKIMDNPQGRVTISATYNEEQVKMSAVTPTGQQSLALPLSDMTFDNEAVLIMLRTMAWQEGVESCFDGIVVDNAHKYFAWVKILEQQRAACELGELNAWHVKLSFDSGTTQDLWYGVEPPHFLVRYKNSYFMLVLRQVNGSINYKGEEK